MSVVQPRVLEAVRYLVELEVCMPSHKAPRCWGFLASDDVIARTLVSARTVCCCPFAFIGDHIPTAPSAEGGIESSITIAKALERPIKERGTVWLL